MIKRAQQRFDLKSDHLAGDVAYGTGKMLGWLIERGIEPHIPVWDKSRRTDDTFSRADFNYDKDRDLYICPANKILKTTGNIGSDNTLRYFASKHDCNGCSLKAKCCLRTPSRKVTRDINEAPEITPASSMAARPITSPPVIAKRSRGCSGKQNGTWQ
jgi:hypothetical protein